MCITVRTCKLCGCELQARRTKSGKHKGSVYYTKLCSVCLVVHRREHINKPRMSEYPRKHPKYKRCAVCNAMFSTKGRSNAHNKLKTCSEDCENVLHSRAACARDCAHLTLAPNRFKGWEKTFERRQTVPSVACGSAHWASLITSLLTPSGERYKVINVTEFVREHEHLFLPSDVLWIPSRNTSKTISKNGRPSTAKGCLKCRAAQGLLSIASGRRESWKGWTAALL